MSTYFISDQHYHHRKVLDFEDRPFDTLEEMHQGLIEAHNNVVNKTDIVYMLGDFCFGNHHKWVEILNQLRGKVILIKGNHDKMKIINRVMRDGYLDEIHTVGASLKADGFTLNMTHYPMDIGNRPRNFSIHGHLHGHPSRMYNQINIGVDSKLARQLNKPFGTPISLNELVEYLHEVNPLVEAEFLKEREK